MYTCEKVTEKSIRYTVDLLADKHKVNHKTTQTNNNIWQADS